MILDVNDVALSYGDHAVLRNVSFQIHENERVAVVGHNGSGKTTLLRVITGELEATSGFFALNAGATMGYLKQTAGLNEQNTVLGEVKSAGDADKLLARMQELERTMAGDAERMKEYANVSARYESIDGYRLEYHAKMILNGMAFRADCYDQPVSVLSGGERTRLALAKLLVTSPDLLILDEPTNHLDIDTLEWLETFLMNYRGSVLVVSHDRHFLDTVSTRTLELQNGKAIMYNGGFSAYQQQKEMRERREAESYRRTVAEAERLTDYARRNIVRASTSNMAKSRLKMLGRLDMTTPDSSAHTAVHFSIEPGSTPHQEVIVAEKLCISVGEKRLIEGLNVILRRGEHLAVIGANGTGKTTFLRTLQGKHKLTSGTLRLGGGVKLSVLEQNLFGRSAQTPLEFIWDCYPAMSQLEVRSLLAAVGFRGEDVFSPVQGLSGGEIARLHLARISLERPNLLLLDEPTNHLDIYTKDTIYAALRDYSGTMVVVTHDRYLIKALNCRVLQISGKQGYLYESYQAYQEENAEKALPRVETEKNLHHATPLPEKAPSPKEQRKQRAQGRERRLYLEKRIAELEGDIPYLEEEMDLPKNFSDHEKLSDLCEMLEGLRTELATLSDEWLECYAD